MDHTIFKMMFGAAQGRPGQAQWTTPGTYSWVVPLGVYFISAVCIGAGGGSLLYSGNTGSAGGGGGGLRYARRIDTFPGETLTIVVGNSPLGTAGGISSVSRGATALLLANGGGVGFNSSDGVGGNGTPLDSNIGGGNGGQGGVKGSSTAAGGGGGGAGGYSGNGGSVLSVADATPSGGAGGGGGRGNSQYGAGGGGVGLYGEGASGVNGLSSSDTADNSATGGTGGSGGTAGNRGTAVQQSGGQFGGGAGGTIGDLKRGGFGAVRIIWGSNRAYPSTNTQDI